MAKPIQYCKVKKKKRKQKLQQYFITGNITVGNFILNVISQKYMLEIIVSYQKIFLL